MADTRNLGIGFVAITKKNNVKCCMEVK